MRVLVCGGRDYMDLTCVCATLDEVAQDGCRVVIHGGAPGADHFADYWASRNAVPVEVFRADWKAYGRAAGPIRNQRMIDEGRPDLVIAFPGGRGTADIVRRARENGIEVREIAPSPNGT